MATAGFNIRLSTSNVDAVKRALEQVGRSGESALKQIERSARSSNDQGLRAVNAGLRELQFASNAAVSRLGPVGAGLSALGPAGLVAGTGIAAIGAALFSAVTAADRWEREQLKINALLATTRQASGQTAASIEELAVTIGRETLATTEEVRQASAALLTFRSVSGEAFGRTLEVAQDLAAVMGTNLRAEVVRLGKALEDPARNLSSLNESGISFTQTQIEVIKRLKETGKEAEAMGTILATIEGQVGGAGAAEAGGLTGAFDRLTEAMGRFIERSGQASGVGSVLAQVFGGAARGIEGTTDALFGSGSDRDLRQRQGSLIAELQRLRGARELPFGAGLLFEFGAGSSETIKQRELDQILAEQSRRAREREQAATAAQLEARRRIREELEAENAALAEKAALLPEITKEQAEHADLYRLQRQAEEESLKALEKYNAERAAAKAGLERLIASAEREPELARLTSEEREIQVALLEAQEEVGRRLTAQEAGRIRSAIQQRQAIEDTQAATVEALRAAERQAEASARIMETPAAEIPEEVLIASAAEIEQLFAEAFA